MRAMSGSALLAQCLESPDDDAPKLVYADWLEEQSQPFAELIRAQCANNAKRVTSTMRKHRKAWLGDIEDWVDKKQPFTRGMLDHIYGSTGKYVQKATQAALHAALSVFGVRRTILRGQSAKLPSCGTLAFTCELKWIDCQADDKILGALAESPHVGLLSSLVLEKVRCTNAGIGKLARSKKLTRVRHFGLPAPVHLGDFDTKAVIGVVDRLPIESLEVGHAFHVSAGVLGNAAAASKLKSLRMTLGREVKKLFQTTRLTGLEALELFVFDYVDDDAIEPLLDNPAFAKLQSLRLNVPRALSAGLAGRLRKRFGKQLAYSAPGARR
jgi:uncharacterized protein (TIGR02996 family)